MYQLKFIYTFVRAAYIIDSHLVFSFSFSNLKTVFLGEGLAYMPWNRIENDHKW